jgi:hypothetical protein
MGIRPPSQDKYNKYKGFLGVKNGTFQQKAMVSKEKRRKWIKKTSKYGPLSSYEGYSGLPWGRWAAFSNFSPPLALDNYLPRRIS